MSRAVSVVGCLLVSLLFATAASSQSCPTYTYGLQLAYTGTNCTSADSTTRCAVGTPVTLSMRTSSGNLYPLQSCETGFIWSFNDGNPNVTTTTATVTHTFPNTPGSYYASVSATAGTSYSQNYAAGYVRVANGVTYITAPLTTVAENAGSVAFKVRSTYAPATVDYYTSDSYGNAGIRFTAVQGTLSFAAGETEKTVNVPVIDNSTFDGAASFSLNLRNPTGGLVLGDYYSSTPSSLSVNITDNDPPPTFDFAGTFPLDISEASGTYNVDVVRTGDMLRTVQLQWYADYYSSTNGILTFGPNETRKTISITIPHDNVWQLPRARTLTIQYPSNGGVIAPNTYSKTVTFNVVDDTPAPTFTIGNASIVEGNSGTQTLTFPVTLSAPLNVPILLMVSTADGTASAGSDYVAVSTNIVFNAGETSKSVNVTIKGDTTVEPDETFTVAGTVSDNYYYYSSTPTYSKYLTVKNGTGTIANDDLGMAWLKVPVGTKGRMSIQLGNRPTASDTVTLTSSQPSIATVPPSFALTTTVANQSFEVTGIAAGTSTITAKLPASAGGGTLQAIVQVYSPATLTATPSSVTVIAGSTANVALNFSPAPGAPLTLHVGASSANVQVPATVTIDAGGNGVLSIKGLTAGGASVTVTQPDANGAFDTTIYVTVTPPPTGVFVTAVAPPNGPTAGGTPVTIAGQNFTSACTVTFGGSAAANVAFTSPTVLTATTPAHAPGSVDVGVTCGSGSYTFANGFTYTAATPQITSVSPAFGSTRGSTLVSVSGTNIRSSCGVLFGGTSSRIVNDLSPDRLVVAAPAHATGDSVDVTLQCGTAASTLRSAFTYTSADEPSAVISDVDPIAAAPGQNVTITGVRFRPSDGITFDAARAAIASTTPTTQVVTVPALAPGRVAVTLKDLDGHTTTTGPIFTILEPVTPEITSAQPAHVAPGGELTITGKGFRAPYAFVLGNTSIGTVVELTFNRAVVRIAPSFSAGTYTLGVVNGDGNLAAVGPKVDVAGTVAITGSAPQCASASGGAKLTITGTGFAAGARVWIGGTEVSGVNVIDAKTIEVTVPEAHLGWTMVRVTNASGDSDTLTHGVLYYSPFEPSPCTTPSRGRGAHH